MRDTRRYAGGGRASQGELRDGARQGTWTFWDEHGRVAAQHEFVDGRREGWCVRWHAFNGKRRSEGRHRAGRREGAWIFRHAGGALRGEGIYVAGRPEGLWRMWHDNGELALQGRFVAGRRDGPWTWRHRNGESAAEGAWAGGSTGGREAATITSGRSMRSLLKGEARGSSTSWASPVFSGGARLLPDRPPPGAPLPRSWPEGSRRENQIHPVRSLGGEPDPAAALSPTTIVVRFLRI